MSAAGSQSVLTLYRAILKNARFYPSSKRDGIIREAKALFHEHRDLTDGAKIAKELQQARIGLQELQQYAPANLEADGVADEWKLTLRGATLPDDVSTDVLQKK